MKALENKSTKMVDEGIKLDYVCLIKICLNQPPDGGFVYAHFEPRRRIDSVIAEVKENNMLEFEDADAKNLKQIVSVAHWLSRHDDIVAFCDDVNNL